MPHLQALYTADLSTTPQGIEAVRGDPPGSLPVPEDPPRKGDFEICGCLLPPVAGVRVDDAGSEL